VLQVLPVLPVLRVLQALRVRQVRELLPEPELALVPVLVQAQEPVSSLLLSGSQPLQMKMSRRKAEIK
jgi:hypothetical protein